jgi:hypothetical protein
MMCVEKGGAPRDLDAPPERSDAASPVSAPAVEVAAVETSMMEVSTTTK